MPMNRPLVNLLAVSLLGGGIWLGVRALRPAGPAADPSAPAARRLAEEPRSRPAPAPALIRRLSDPGLSVPERIAAVRDLPSDLTDREASALIDLLRQPTPEKVGVSVWHALLNEIMEVLRQPRFSWTGYGPAMAGLITDRETDPVVRDYAAQHLALYLAEEADRRAPGSLAPGMDAFLTVLRGERESRESVTGTVLMALCDLRSKRPAADFEPYAAPLASVVADFISGTRDAGVANRIAAIQAAGRMGLSEALPVIRRFAREGAPDPSLRLSSIAALGYFADPADRPFLEQLATSGDPLRFAAQAALNNHSR